MAVKGVKSITELSIRVVHSPEPPTEVQARCLGHTAVQIAAALGCAPQGVRSALRNIPSNGVAIVRGRESQAWCFQNLPPRLRAAAETAARKQNFLCPETFLARAGEPWKPSGALEDVPQRYIDKAAKLREALSWVLANRDDPSFRSVELREQGRRDFQRAFGGAVSDVHWRRLFKRTIERDRGAEEWHRIELYLDDSIAKGGRGNRPGRKYQADLSGLRLAVAQAGNPSTPDATEIQLVWAGVFQEFEAQIAQGRAAKKLKRAFLDCLESEAPFLAKNRATLDRQFRYKLTRWRDAGGKGCSLKDRRSERAGGAAAPELDEGTRKLLIARALNCGGRVSQAWRELYREGKLPAAFYEFYVESPDNKSYMPRRIRESVTADVRRLSDIHIGPKQARLKGPKVNRDWSQMPSGVQAQSDDCTLPVYFWIPDPNSKTGCRLLRGQFLPWIDTRTTYIYNFQLLPKETYSSMDILRGLIRLNDEFGLPEQLHLERGIWKNSLLISGRGDEVAWAERVAGLSDLGIDLIHALDPSAKVVERVLGALQNLMERDRGYAGRDERRDRPEHISKAMQMVKSGKAHPGQYFFSYVEWVERLSEICDQYNDELKNGKMLDGLSPRQAFVRLLKCPPVRLDERTRYLLATNRRTVKVTANGVTIRIGKTAFNYRSEATGELQGRKVAAWFDIEDPEYITLTDLNFKNPVTVPRATEVPAYRADSEIIAQAKRESAAHASYGRALYSDLKKEHPEEFGGRFARPNLVDQGTLELGESMRAQREELQAAERREKALLRKGQCVARDLGITLTGDRARLSQKISGMEKLKRLGVISKES